MSDFTTVPCYNCICVPICRNKSFRQLYFDCKLLIDYIAFCDRSVNNGESSYSRSWIHDILKPDGWNVNDRGNVINERMKG